MSTTTARFFVRVPWPGQTIPTDRRELADAYAQIAADQYRVSITVVDTHAETAWTVNPTKRTTSPALAGGLPVY